MKIRSLLLGSVAAAGLATTGFAADLGVVTSLDVCDELGLSGLTLSSDENCLVISGSVSFAYSLGDYHDGDSDADGSDDGQLVVEIDAADDIWADADDGDLDSTLDIDVWLQFVATADSDFGPASATIKLLKEDYAGSGDFWFNIDQAWVGIGDTTMIMAGKKSSIFNDGDDGALDYLGLYGGDADFAGGPTTGGSVIQLVHNLGNGVSVGGGIENLMTSGLGVANPTGVGVIAFAGDGFTAHASGAADLAGAWKVHAGFTGTFDPIKVVAAVSADSTTWWNAVGSISATFDMFTLAASGEATSTGEWGASGSASAEVSEGVKLNLGARTFTDGGAQTASQIEAGISAGVTETITLTAAAGYVMTTGPAGDHFYGKAGLAWAPGGGFTSSVEGQVNSLGGYKGTFKAAKTIK